MNLHQPFYTPGGKRSGSTETHSSFEGQKQLCQASSSKEIESVSSTSLSVADSSIVDNITLVINSKNRNGKTTTNKNITAAISTIPKGGNEVETNKVEVENTVSEGDVEVDVEIDCGNASEDHDLPHITPSEYKAHDLPVSSGHLKTKTIDKMNQMPYFEIHQNILDQLSSLETPSNELLLLKDIMNDLEKTAYQELLTSVEDKSQHIYLELRNHIIFKWQCKKPNYVTKAYIRKDLARSVDSKTLSKLHSFLEQIGAINYGCGRVKYVRPLQRFMDCLWPKRQDTIQSKRCRRKKFLNNGEGGCTVSHGINGEIIDTVVVNEEQPHPKKRVRKKPIYLIYCQPFNQRNGYQLQLHISALLCMDFHAHSSLSEVMGLIGGSWDSESKILSIMHYEPCKNAASSITHCDMCPISQAKSAERINNLNMDLLGWFHSHPTFAPEPSQQDVETQREFQECIGFSRPVIGIILTPFNKRDFLCSSDYRCLIVEKSKSGSGYTPYRLKVDVSCTNFDIDTILENISKIHLASSENNKFNLNFKDAYFYDTNVTYKDKFISSARMRLEKYIPDVAIRMRIIRGIEDICKR